MKVSPVVRLFSLTIIVFVSLFARSVSHPIIQSTKLDNTYSPCLPDVFGQWDPQTFEGVWFDLARTNLVYKSQTWTNGKTSIAFQTDYMQIDYQGLDDDNQCQSSSLQFNRSQVDQGFFYIDKIELNGNAVSVVAVCLNFTDVKQCKESGHLDLFVWSRNRLTNESSDELRSELATVLEKYCISKENMVFTSDFSLPGDVCKEPIENGNMSTTPFIVADLSMQVATESVGEKLNDNLVQGTTPTLPSSSLSISKHLHETILLTTGSVLANKTQPDNMTVLVDQQKKTRTNSTQVAHLDEINVSVLIEPIAKENSIEKDLLNKMNQSQVNTTKSNEFNANAVDVHSNFTSTNHTEDEEVDFDGSFTNGTLPITSLKKQMVEDQTINSTEQENSVSLNTTLSETFSEEMSQESTSTSTSTQKASTIAATSTTSAAQSTTSESLLGTEPSTTLIEKETVKAGEKPTETSTEGFQSTTLETSLENSTVASSSTDTKTLAESTSRETTINETTETTSQNVQVLEAVTQISINVTETLLSEPTVRIDDRNESAALNLSKKSDLDEEPSETETLVTTTQAVQDTSTPQHTTDETITKETTNETQSFLIDSAPLDENVTQNESTANETIITAATTEPSVTVTLSGPIEEERSNVTESVATKETSTVFNVEDVIILTTFETHVITSEDEDEEDNQAKHETSTSRPTSEQEEEHEREQDDDEDRETTTRQREDHDDDDDHEEEEEDDERAKVTPISSTTMETSTTTTFMCPKTECQVKNCNFGRRRDELGCETCDCMRDPADSNHTQCTETVCHPCFYGAYTDENGCESCACKPRPKPKNIYECPQLECASCNYGSIKDEYGCETCICIRPNSLERSYPCPPEPTCPFGACKHGSVLNDYGCATCECLKSNEPEHDLECTRQRCEPCPHGYFTDGDGCETCLCKPDWMAPCALVELSCDPTSECPHGTYLDRNGCPSCECLPDPTLKSDCYHMKEIDEQIECNPDGSFKSTQCNDEDCRCVTKYGAPISEFRVNVSDADRMNCECALALYEISVYKAIGFKLYCLPNGNYETIQCVGGSCACVNEHGDPLGPSVPIYQKHLLRCEGVFQNVYEDQFVTTMAPVTLTKPLCIYHQERATEMSNIDAHLSIPNCDDRGLYAPLQCDRHNKYCWCVNVHNGVELYGSRRTADQKPDCSDDEDD